MPLPRSSTALPTIACAPRSITSRRSRASRSRPSVAASLRKRYGKVVAGLKDSSGDFKQFQAFRAARSELAITVGNEADIARAIAAGGAGTICGMANIAPELVKAMIDGKDVEARMQAAVDIVVKTPSFLATLKAILAAQTGDASWLRVRPPLACLVRRHRAQAEARRADDSRHRLRSRNARHAAARIRAQRVAVAAKSISDCRFAFDLRLERFNTRAIQVPPTVLFTSRRLLHARTSMWCLTWKWIESACLCWMVSA